MADTYIEEVFDITNNERLALITGSKGSLKITQFENQSGAKISVGTERNKTIIRIFGDKSQRGQAKVLIRDVLEKTSFIPTISYFILAESGLDNNRLKFVESSEKSNGRSRYLVKFLNNDDNQIGDSDEFGDINIEDFLHITPCQFNTFDKIDDCLDILSSKLKSNSRKNSFQIILKPRIFFGKVLFSEINNPEEPFTLKEWYKFNVMSGRARRGSENAGDDNTGRVTNGKTVNVEFQQDSPQIYDDFKTLQQKFGFKVHHKRANQEKDRGSIYIYYNSTNKKRKLKLRWNEEENKWKIANHSHSINRLANVDVISGTNAPDFRLSLKTHYDLLPDGPTFENIIDNIQYSQSFDERDELCFKSSDFDNTLMQKVVVRQVIEKKRFRNENYHITFSSIRHCDCNDHVTIQKLITLKHHTWAQDVTLDNTEGFMNNVFDTLGYVQEMMEAFV